MKFARANRIQGHPLIDASVRRLDQVPDVSSELTQIDGMAQAIVVLHLKVKNGGFPRECLCKRFVPIKQRRINVIRSFHDPSLSP